MHKFSLNRLSLSILFPAVLIVGITLSVLYSIDPSIARQQLFFLVVSLVAYFLFLNIDYQMFGVFAKPLYFVMIALLLILFVIGIEARGAVRWVDILGVRLQFSEIIKPFFVLFMATYITSSPSRSFGKFLFALVLVAPIFILILRQPDLGNAMIYLIVTLFMLLAAGFPLKYFLTVGVLGSIPLPLIYSLLHDYQRARIATFVNPSADPFGASYNAVQSLISVGSGGFFGKGFGQATQSILEFLPERHTDFIFAAISESLGFVGASIVTGLFFYLVYKIYKAALESVGEFERIAIFGFYFLFITHIFLNIGMNLGIVPIVGITLPFASYGGSSLLTSFITLGIISSINFSRSRHGALEIS